MTQEDHASDAVRFVQLVAMFQMASMQAMGKLVNPATNEVERDLEQARGAIDMLEMLERRTEGNRSAEESEMLEKVLFELRMNFVDESRREDADVEDEGDDAGAGSDSEAGGSEVPEGDGEGGGTG